MTTLERNMKLMRAAIIEQTAAIQALKARITVLENHPTILPPEVVRARQKIGALNEHQQYGSTGGIERMLDNERNCYEK